MLTGKISSFIPGLFRLPQGVVPTLLDDTDPGAFGSDELPHGAIDLYGAASTGDVSALYSAARSAPSAPCPALSGLAFKDHPVTIHHRSSISPRSSILPRS